MRIASYINNVEEYLDGGPFVATKGGPPYGDRSDEITETRPASDALATITTHLSG